MRIAALTVGLMTVFTLLIIATRALGAAQSPSASSLLATNPCALPCLWGVTAGQSTREEALAVLPTTTGQPVADVGAGLLYFTVAAEHHGSAQGIVLIDLNDRSTVQTLRLSPITAGLPVATLAEALLYGLPPRSVFRTCDGITPPRLLIIFGEHAELMVEAVLPTHVSPSMPLTLFDLSVRNIRSSYDARASFGCSIETGWRGFAPRWRYFAATPAVP